MHVELQKTYISVSPIKLGIAMLRIIASTSQKQNWWAFFVYESISISDEIESNIEQQTNAFLNNFFASIVDLMLIFACFSNDFIRVFVFSTHWLYPYSYPLFVADTR